MTSAPWSSLVRTWFGDTLDDPHSIPGRMGWWFSADERRDAELGRLYGGLVEQCANGEMYRWVGQPEGRLAMILALDQLPRNLFRGTRRAFTHDAQSAALCLAAVQSGHDRSLQPIQRAFLYMPLQHFEDLAGQEAGVRLYQALAQENSDWPVFRDGFLSHAKVHHDIIARFGRFPHRNTILGRESTEEERAYLAANAPTFGQ